MTNTSGDPRGVRIDWQRVATTGGMSPDAYREFCWGAQPPQVASGYGLLRGNSITGGQLITAVLADVEYTRLLAQSQNVIVPSEKITKILTDWPNLDPLAESIWS